MTFTVILIGLCINIVASELLGLSTLAAKAVVKWAVKRHIPEGMQREVEDEWLSHVEGMNDGPKFLQLYQAITIALGAAPQIGREAREAIWSELGIELERLSVDFEREYSEFLKIKDKLLRIEGEVEKPGTEILKVLGDELAKLEEDIRLHTTRWTYLEGRQEYLVDIFKKLTTD